MSWVPRVVGPTIRAFRQIALRRSARTVAKQVVQSVPRLRSRFQKAKAKPRQRKSTGMVGPMPFYRRRYYPRRRRFPARRIIRKTANKIHTFVRWCDKDSTYGDYGPNVISETGGDQHLTYQFKLDQVTGVSDFTNLYDGYKINKIQLFLEPLIDNSSSTLTAGTLSKKIRVVHDYNDASPLGDEDTYLEYGNCKSYFPWSKRGIRITLYPKLNNIIENVGGTATGYTSMNSNRQFLNIASDEVPHFGIKMFIPRQMTVTDTVMFRVRAKFWMSMRGTK